MSSDTRPFAPLHVIATGTGFTGLTPSVTVTATNGSATASTIFPGTQFKNGSVQIMVSNKTTAWAHINFGAFGNIVAATVAASLPVAPGAVRIFSVSEQVSGASVILDASSTPTAVIFTRGDGL